MADSGKARRELGWKTRPLQAGMLDTFRWIAQEEEAFLASDTAKRQQWAIIALGLSFVLLVMWILGRRKK